jgi:hypothetical protein
MAFRWKNAILGTALTLAMEVQEKVSTSEMKENVGKL